MDPLMSGSSSSRPLTPGEKWTTAILLVLVLSLFSVDIAIDFSVIKLSALFIILFWVPLLVTHEAGHAIMARLLGFHVGRITLGTGRLWKRIERPGYFIEIRALPVMGFVAHVPRHLRSVRLRSAAVSASGPGADFAVATIVLFALGPDKLFSSSSDLWTILLQSLAIAATAQGTLNLLPVPSFDPREQTTFDGANIVLAFTRPDSYYASMIDSFRENGSRVFEDDPGDFLQDRKPDPEEWWKQGRRL